MPTPSPASLPSLWTFVPWVLTTIGIAASLGWNWYNHREQRRLREDAKRFDEFKRVRSTIDVAIAAFDERRCSLDALRVSAAAATKLRKQIADEQKLLATSFVSLQAALNKANSSSYTDGDDWLIKPEEHWDNAVTCLDSATNASLNVERCKSALDKAVKHLGELVEVVERRLEDQMKKF